MELHPKLIGAYRVARIRYGKTRVGSLAHFASIFGDRVVPEAAREQFMTIAVHLNARSAVGTRVCFNQRDAQWYDELCNTLGVDALEWRGQAIDTIRPVSQLASLQPIHPRPTYVPGVQERAGAGHPHAAPEHCRPGTFKRRQARYRSLAGGIGRAVTAMAVKATGWADVKSRLRDTPRVSALVRREARAPALHAHLTRRTVAAVCSAVKKERRNIQRLKQLQARADSFAERQNVGHPLAGAAPAASDGFSDDEEDDEEGIGASRSGYALDESSRMELDELPAQIEQAIGDHLLHHEGALRQSYSYLALASPGQAAPSPAVAAEYSDEEEEDAFMPALAPGNADTVASAYDDASDDDMPALRLVNASEAGMPALRLVDALDDDMPTFTRVERPMARVQAGRKDPAPAPAPAFAGTVPFEDMYTMASPAPQPTAAPTARHTIPWSPIQAKRVGGVQSSGRAKNVRFDPSVSSQVSSAVRAPSSAASAEDTAIFFIEHETSMDIFKHAAKEYGSGMARISATYADAPVHVALQRYTALSESDAKAIINDATVDKDKTVLTHIATMCVRASRTAGVPGFTDAAHPGYMFHSVEECS